MDFVALTDIAIEAARAAGEIIRRHMDADVTVLEKAGGESRASQVLTKVDLACETTIINHLQPSCKAFDLALLSEETEDDGSRFEKPFFWCIDPMDGTLAFINKTPGFSVSIALVARGGTPYIGVVYDPSTDTLYHATKGKGAFKNGKVWTISRTNQYLTYVTDRKLADSPRQKEIKLSLKHVLDKLNALKSGRAKTEFEELAGGGAVINAIRVLENGPACMFKLPKLQRGGGSVWDYAATACIYQELGLPVTDFGGRPLDLNMQKGTFMNTRGVFYENL